MNGLVGTKIPPTGVPLPIGISFYTFQTMSYTIDVYRGRVKAERSLFTLATFVCLFPQLIAGPIVRYTDVAKELRERSTTLSEAAAGVSRFAFGLGKKVLLANALGSFAPPFRKAAKRARFFTGSMYAHDAPDLLRFFRLFDMAVGLGKLFGFSFPENFDYPYISRSITEFWRRWHMTLSGWFRITSTSSGRQSHESEMAAEPPRRLDADRALARRELELRALGALFRRAAGR